ncbi:hypothetical protein CK203_094044 [Vitis vinifera]|uniref:Uncharacterized protein n=1 Tax=Vitis vinifera TaxID=29760 RepID=A0A438E173_VITVI|nr:hypothetical protein CK203_094044 [Vitis vinifera]
MLSSGCDVCECRVLLPKEVRIGERATCPSLGSPDGVAPDSEVHHVSSGGGVPTNLALECGIAYKNRASYRLDFGHDFHWKGDIIRSEHVWLGYQPCSQLRLFQFNDPNYWNYIEISFEVAHRFNSSASNVSREAVTEMDSMEVEWTLVLVVAVRGPLTVPRSSSSANTLKNGYHHPGLSSNKNLSSVDLVMHARNQ